MSAPGKDLIIPPGPGLPQGTTIPAEELLERFSRSPGPGGQSVNTSDTRVELRFAPATSTAFTPAQRERVIRHLSSPGKPGKPGSPGKPGDEGVPGDGGSVAQDAVISIVASEHRSQFRNRVSARERLVALLREAVAPPPPPRRATKPSRASQRRRVESKKHLGRTKSLRGRVRDD